jgi:hypothetical protein
MDMDRINQKAGEIEHTIEDERLEDGITEITAAFTHVLILAIQSDSFSRAKLHTFMSNIENNILSNTSQKQAGIRRLD